MVVPLLSIAVLHDLFGTAEASFLRLGMVVPPVQIFSGIIRSFACYLAAAIDGDEGFRQRCAPSMKRLPLVPVQTGLVLVLSMAHRAALCSAQSVSFPIP